MTILYLEFIDDNVTKCQWFNDIVGLMEYKRFKDNSAEYHNISYQIETYGIYGISVYSDDLVRTNMYLYIDISNDDYKNNINPTLLPIVTSCIREKAINYILN